MESERNRNGGTGHGGGVSLDCRNARSIGEACENSTYNLTAALYSSALKPPFPSSVCIDTLPVLYQGVPGKMHGWFTISYSRICLIVDQNPSATALAMPDS